MRLLLADDDADIRLLAGALLRHAGFEVVEAESGHEALALLSAGRWDGLVVDVQMPEMSGPQLVSELAGSAAPHYPVVFLTGDPDDPALADLNPAGVVAKPFDPATLGSRIRGLLAGHGCDVQAGGVCRTAR